MQYNWDISDLGYLQFFIIVELKPRLWKRDAINPIFKSGKPLLFARFILNSAKEVLECLVHSVRNILLVLGMYFKIFAGQILIIVKLVQGNISEFVSILRQGKQFIIDCFASFERFNDSFLLNDRRIQSVFIHQQVHKSEEYY